MTEELEKKAGKPVMQVEMAVLLPGNCGCNNARIFIDDTNPDEAPGLEFIPIDSDVMLLQERFSVKHANPGTNEANLQKWQEVNKLDVIQLDRKTIEEEEKNQILSSYDGNSGFRRHRKLFGAGGDVEAGRRAVKSALPQIEEHIRGKDLILSWGAGGGGTGTAAMEEIADAAQRLKVPLLSILITPFDDEGDKIAVADKLRRDLREKGWVAVIKNQYTPEEKMEDLLSEVYRYINMECRAIFRALREYTQVVGTSNAALEALFTAFDKGRDVYIGIYEVDLKGATREDGKPPKVDTEAVVEGLLNHTLQDKGEKGIEAGALLFCFRGPWSAKAMREIRAGVKKAARCSPNAFIKSQNFERSDDMWASVIMVGSYPSQGSTLSSEDQQWLTSGDNPKDRSTEVRERYRNETKKPLYESVGPKRRVEFLVPVTVYDNWKDAQSRGDLKTLKVIAEEIQVLCGQAPNVSA